jgi:hypothetical protein
MHDALAVGEVEGLGHLTTTTPLDGRDGASRWRRDWSDSPPNSSIVKPAPPTLPRSKMRTMFGWLRAAELRLAQEALAELGIVEHGLPRPLQGRDLAPPLGLEDGGHPPFPTIPAGVVAEPLLPAGVPGRRGIVSGACGRGDPRRLASAGRRRRPRARRLGPPPAIHAKTPTSPIATAPMAMKPARAAGETAVTAVSVA